MTDRTIKVRLEAEVSQYQKNMDDAAKATELLAAKADVAAKKVDYAAKVQETAASKVKAAEESLKKVRSDSKATADQVRAAEENLAKAKLDESSASLTLRESTQQLEAAQRAQGDAADIQTSKMKRAGAFWKENRADIDKTATSLMVVGGAGVGALGLMTKQAISWESAWAGVTKTVNATDAELASLQAGLRQMATELPATHEEIAAVAEAAGQLGIQTPNILGFTRTIIDLGEATNIVGEEGAKSLAQFMNIMQTSQGDVGRLGSTIVALGNNFATTESDILALSMRLAGAGKQAGLTESDVMGIAAAMSSVGIESEAGGTAMSTTMKRIGREVEMSGDKLGLFASVAGMSAQDFSTAWGQDAAGALSAFVAGLGNTEHLGMSTNAVLAELGITAQREADALLRLSGAQGIVNDALVMGGQAFAENSALAEEAAARYATTESQMKIAMNSIKDAGIEVGSYVLPILADLSAGVADMAGWFAGLPDPVQKTIVAVGGFGSVTALAVGGTLKMAGSISDSVTAMKNLTNAMPRTATAITGIAKGAGIAGAALLAMWGAEQLTRQKVAVVSIEEATEKILNLADSADGAWDDIDALFSIEPNGNFWTGGGGLGLDGIADGLRKVTSTDLGFFEKMEKNMAWLPGIDDAGFRQAAETFENMDKSMSGLVSSGHADKAEEMWQRLSAKADELGVSTEDLTALFPEYSAALKQAENDTRLAADATAEAEAAAAAAQAEVDALGQAFDDQAAAADAAWDALFSWVSGATTAEKARITYEASIRGVSDALKENGKTLDITTEKGQANRLELVGLVEDTMALIAAEREQGASEEDLQAIMQRSRDTFISMADQVGLNSEEMAAYADQLGLTPEVIDTAILLETQEAKQKMEGFVKELFIAGSTLEDWEISADGTSAIHEATDTKAWIDKQTGEIKIEGKDESATSEARKAAEKINNTKPSMPIGAHQTPDGKKRVSNFQALIRKQQSVPMTAYVSSYAGLNNFRSLISRPVSVPMVATRSGPVVDFAAMGKGGGANGGRAGSLPKKAAGGRLPATGLGTDQILGVGSHGGPTAWVDDLEWIINRRSSDKFDPLLNAINQDSPSVQHLAGDGLASYAQSSPQSYPVAPTVSVAQAGQQQAVSPNFDVHVTVVNPFTGAQVMGVVKDVAVQEIRGNQRMVSAGSRAGRRP